MITRRLKEGSFKSQKLSKTKSRRGALEAKRRRAELGQDLTRNDLLPDLHVQQVGTSELQPSPRRTRRTVPEHIERLMASIADFGFSVPILIARREIVDGHVRVEAALHLGLDTVPAIEVSHLSDTTLCPQLRSRTSQTRRSAACALLSIALPNLASGTWISSGSSLMS